MKGVTNQTIGARLKALREDVHMEQEVVARVLNIPRTAVSALEAGKRDISTIELIELCKLFRISPNDLLRWGKYHSRIKKEGSDEGPLE